MANRAAFTIEGSASSPPGFDASSGQTLTFRIEELPATDVLRTQFEVGRGSDASPELLFPGSGTAIEIAASPSDEVDIEMPTVASSDAHSYEIICRVVTAQGEFVFSRVVSIRNSSGLRKWIESERAEYYEEGWTTDQNDMVDVIQAGGGGGGGGESLAATLAIGNATGALPILVDNSQYIRLGATSPALSGLLRLRRNQGGVKWRDGDLTSDIGIDLDGSDVLQIGAATADGTAETRLLTDDLLTGYILGTKLYEFSRPSGNTGRFAFNPVSLTGGCYVTVDDSGAATPGRHMILKGGTASAASQPGGDAIIQPGSPGAGGAKGSAGIKDSSGTYRVKLDPSNELFYNANSVHNFQVNGATFIQIGSVGSFAAIGAYADIATAGLLIAVNSPTTGVAGVPITILGCEGGTGNQNGGDVALQSGPRTGSGNDGWAGLKDSDANWRLYVDSSKDLNYDPVGIHNFFVNGDLVFTAGVFTGFGFVNFFSDVATAGVLLEIEAPTTGVNGVPFSIVGCPGGTGNRNGGDVFFTLGLHSGTGTNDGSAGVRAADGTTWLFRVDPTDYAEMGNASATPAAPAAGFRIFGAAGAAKVRSSSGTITTFGPAEPHCKKCGLDFSKEWEHPESGRKLSICMWCATAPGGPLAGCVIERMGE